MKGLPKKYAKMGFAKGWSMFKKLKGSAKGKTRKKATRKAAKKTTKKRRKPARQIAGTFPRFIKTKTRSRKRRVNMARGKGKINLMNEVQNVGIGAAGAIGGTMIANMIPIADLRIKAGIPLILGVMLSIFGKGKGALLQKAGLGMAIGGALSTVKALAPGLPMLAGEDQGMISFTPEDVQTALITGEITPEQAAELMGATNDFAGDDDSAMQYAPSDEWQTTENEI